MTMSPRHLSATLALAACSLLAATLWCCTPCAAGQPPAGVGLRASADTLAPDAQQMWRAALTVANGSGFGVYLDSLFVQVSPAGGPSTRQNLPVLGNTRSMSGGDSMTFTVAIPAARTQTRMEFTCYGHAHDITSFLLVASIVGTGFDPERSFPAFVARVGGHEVEMTRVPAAVTGSAGPGVLLVRDAGSDLQADLGRAMQLSRSGMTVVLVSPPGTGRSVGPANPAGAPALAAVAAALDTLAHSTDVDPARLGVWGTGAGGTLALRLAGQRPDVRAVVVQGALVPPGAAAELKTPTLVLQGELDTVAPPAGAHELVTRLQARSVIVESRFFAQAGHALPELDTWRLARRFLIVHTAAAQ